MKRMIFLFIGIYLPPLLWAQTDAHKIEAARVATDSVVANRAYLQETLGIRVMRSNQHPEWVQVDFPLASVSGGNKRRIEAAICELIQAGAEPAFRDSTVTGGYIRTYVPGRVYVHRDVALTTLKCLASGVVVGDTLGAAARDACEDGGWRLYLKKFWPGRF